MSSKQKPLGSLKKVGLSLLGAGLLVVFGYVLVVRPLQIRHQKQQFAKAEAGLDQLYNQIVAKVGKPDQYKKERSCGYASRVYVRGPRSCSITYKSVYKVNSIGGANSLLQSTKNVVNNFQGITIRGVASEHFTALGNSTEHQATGQDFLFGGTYLDCYINYVYAQSGNPFLVLSSGTPELRNVSLELGCGGPAMAEFYPVKN